MVYKWYILPIGGLYATYHLLGEPETTIDLPNHLNMLKLSPFFSTSSKTFETKNAFGNSKLPKQKHIKLGDIFLDCFGWLLKGPQICRPKKFDSSWRNQADSSDRASLWTSITLQRGSGHQWNSTYGAEKNPIETHYSWELKLHLYLL